MAYNSPSDPVAGTVITVAAYVANSLDNIRWLRLLTGNSDPPGSSYVVVSTSTTGTSWQKVPADALAAGVALSNLGYTPLNVAGGTVTGDIVFTGGSGVALDTGALSGRLADTGGFTFLRTRNDIFRVYNAALTLIMLDISSTVVAVLGQIQAASASIAGTISTLGLIQAATAAITGNATVGGTLSIVGTTTAAAINSGPVTSTGLVKGTQVESTVATGTAPMVIASTTQVTNLNASQVVGRVPGTGVANLAFYDGAGQVLSAATATNATNAGTLDSLDSTAFARLAAASDFTTPPTINGDAVAVRANGNYTGTAAAVRQITTGFVPRYVRIVGRNAASTVLVTFDLVAPIASVGQNMRAAYVGGVASMQSLADTYLHATDGFTVNGTGTDNSDGTGLTYYWIAFG